MKNNKSFVKFGIHFYIGILILTGFCLLGQEETSAQDTGAVWGSFTNPLKPVSATNFTSTVFTSGGHIKVSPDADGVMAEPQVNNVKLAVSCFGQIVANTVPYPDFQKDAINRSEKMLYYEYGEGTGDFAKEKAAFRYKVFVYGLDNENNVTAQFQKMATYWTSADYSRALEAAAIIRAALKYDPFHTGLRNVLLDIYYDIAVADLSKATEKIVESQKSTLALPGYLAPAGEFQISKEIELINAAIPLYDNAIKPYFDLLKNPMGIDMARVDSKAALENKCFGYYLFEQEVPGRSLFAPRYQETNGELVAVVNKEVLFTGYKDLVLLFNMERDAAQTAAKLAKLYALRSSAGDADKARTVIGQAQQKSYTEGNKLNEIFPEETNPADPDSGLTEAKAGWATGLSSLSSVKSFLDGNSNPLGLDKDFLALVQTDIPGTGNNLHKDSFNYFADMLIPGGATPGGSLKVAYDRYDLAYNQYEKVRFNEDSIKSELQTQRHQFGDRLRAIAGAEYPDPPNPYSEYHTPEDNTGGEIYLQLHNIELSRKRIEHNHQEILNLEAQIRNEIERRGKEHNINDLIQDTYIRYGDKQARLTKRIGEIKDYAAEQTAFVSWVGGICTGSVEGVINGLIGAANSLIQADAERKTAKLQAEKEKLNAEQSAEITYLNDKISDANSESLVKNLLLGMNTLAIESQEAAIMLAQEIGRLQAILDEKAYLEAEWQKAEQELGTRYFADPSHRIIMDQYIIAADFTFQEAQFWVFTMARALDYKRNTRFVTTYGNKSYTSGSVFKLRNAKELMDMAIALWNYDQKANIGDRQGTQFIKFSLREDFFGYRRLDENNNPATYSDPATGQIVDAITAFRSYLKNVAPHGAPKSSVMNNFSEVVHLEFGTVKSNIAGTFFSSARWNEKIKWISVKINADASSSEIMVYLEQSGTSFIRNSSPGTTNPTYPDRVEGEMTGYPVKYWFKEPNTENWLSKDVFGFGINAVVTNDPYAPAESWQKREFHEMPPAVSKWVLEVPLKSSGGQKLLNLDSVSDIEIWFYNYYHARN